MLREKFPEPPVHQIWVRTSSAEQGTLTIGKIEEAMALLQKDYRRPDKLFINPKQYAVMKQLVAERWSYDQEYLCNWDAPVRVMGMDVAVSESVSAGSMVFMDSDGKVRMKIGDLDS